MVFESGGDEAGDGLVFVFCEVEFCFWAETFEHVFIKCLLVRMEAVALSSFIEKLVEGFDVGGSVDGDSFFLG